MHHHQNGRLVVSGEERVVDNSWLIIFFSLSPLPVFLSFLIVPVVRVRFKFDLRNLFVLLLLLSQSYPLLNSACSCPLPLLS